MKEKIKKIIEDIKPSIRAHGGDVDFVDFDDKKGIVKVHLRGACAHCPMSEITLKEVILSALKKEFPIIKGIEKV